MQKYIKLDVVIDNLTDFLFQIKDARTASKLCVLMGKLQEDTPTIELPDDAAQ